MEIAFSLNFNDGFRYDYILSKEMRKIIYSGVDEKKIEYTFNSLFVYFLRYPSGHQNSK